MEIVDQYRYLGLVLDEHASLKLAYDTLAQSAGRALGSIINLYKTHKDMGFKTYTQLYNSCVTPILNYCAPIWATKEISSIEQIQCRALRTFIGVHRFVPILGLYGDTGWMPCFFLHKIEILKFWNRLVRLEDNRILKKVFDLDFEAGLPNSWCQNVRYILSEIGMEDAFRQKEPCDIDLAKDAIKICYEQAWSREILQKPKLRTYRKFKTTVNLESYISNYTKPIERSLVGQIRFGILPLEIETGRYKSVPPGDRLCKCCSLELVEDEIHFLFICPLYSNVRRIWLQEINIIITS